MASTTVVGSRNSGDGEQKKSNKGGFKTMPFILGNDVCDRFATAGFGANMITYLTEQLHLPLGEASNLLTNFGGTSSLTPILGALAADSLVGRFWTIIAGSAFYQLGMLGLVVSALLPSLRPAPCPLTAAGTPTPACRRASCWQLAVLYLSLLCTSLGSGGLRPCVVAFGTDQFDQEPPDQEHRRQKQGGGGGGAQAEVLQPLLLHHGRRGAAGADGGGVDPGQRGVGVRDPGHRHVRLHRCVRGRVPAVRPSQARGEPVHEARAGRRRRVQEAQRRRAGGRQLAVPGQGARRAHLHQRQAAAHRQAYVLGPGSDCDAGRHLRHRGAGPVASVDGAPRGGAQVHRPHAAHLVRRHPARTADSHNGTFTITQARTMDRRVTRHFEIPPATMSIFGTTAMLVSLALYDRAFVPLARRVTGRPSGITYFQRMGVGLAISILGVGTAALVETKRRGVAAYHGLLDSPAAVVPISVFWLVPQFAIHGVAGAFSSVGHMEFLYDQAPESMRSTAAALFWLASSLGHYLGTALVTAVQRATRDRGDWLQDNINRGRIDSYYWLVTCLMVLNLGYYLVCFHLYTMKPLEMATDEQDGECELSSSLQKNGTGDGVV